MTAQETQRRRKAAEAARKAEAARRAEAEAAGLSSVDWYGPCKLPQGTPARDTDAEARKAAMRASVGSTGDSTEARQRKAEADSRYTEYLCLLRRNWQADVCLLYTGTTGYRATALRRAEAMLASLRLNTHRITIPSRGRRQGTYLLYVTQRPIVTGRSAAAHVLTHNDIVRRMSMAQRGTLSLPLLGFTHVGPQETQLPVVRLSYDWVADVYLDVYLLSRGPLDWRLVERCKQIDEYRAEHAEAAEHARRAGFYTLAAAHREAAAHAERAAEAPQRPDRVRTATLAAAARQRASHAILEAYRQRGTLAARQRQAEAARQAAERQWYIRCPVGKAAQAAAAAYRRQRQENQQD